MRINDHPIVKIPKQKRLSFYFNDKLYEGVEGDTIASALWANQITILRQTEKKGQSRSLFCGIGNCYDCRVYIKDHGMVRACITPISKGMEIFSSDRGVENETI